MTLRKSGHASLAGGPIMLRRGWPHDPAKLPARWPHDPANRQTCGCLRGPTTSVVTFTGCPSCPGEVATPGAPWGTGISPRDVFASCGFPN